MYRSKTLSVTLAVLLALLAGASSVLAQGRAAAYLKLGVGARALGLGGAFTAVADDATALFWNPAGLSALKRAEATGMHANLSLDRDYNFLGYASPWKDGEAWGIGYTRFSVDSIPETRVRPGTNQPQLTDDLYDGNNNFIGAGPGQGDVKIFSLFEDLEHNLTVSYARKMNDRLRLGASVRILEQRLFTADAQGIGLDLGALYSTGGHWTFGLALKDLFEELDWNDGRRTDDVPVTASFGAAYRGIRRMLITAEASKIEDHDLKLRVGAERWFKDRYALRVATNDGDFAAGASVRLRDWLFDFAYQTQELGDIQRLSFLKKF